MCGPAYTLHKRCRGSVSRRIPLKMCPGTGSCQSVDRWRKTSYFFWQHVHQVRQAFFSKHSPQVVPGCTNCNSNLLKGLTSSRGSSHFSSTCTSRLPHSLIVITRKQPEMCRRHVVYATFSCGDREPVEQVSVVAQCPSCELSC